jgi:hypothetical protein
MKLILNIKYVIYADLQCKSIVTFEDVSKLRFWNDVAKHYEAGTELPPLPK